MPTYATMSDNKSHRWLIHHIPTVTLHWGARNHMCQWCHIELLTGERSGGFCCGPQGKRAGDVLPLPPLPQQYNTFINHSDISSLSRSLNLVFSFASLETTASFPTLPGGPSFFAIQGHVYHRIRPEHQNSAVHWILHDGFMLNQAPFSNIAKSLPQFWILALQQALMLVNLFARSLKVLSLLGNELCPNAEIVLLDSGTAEISALMTYNNTALQEVNPRRIVISRSADNHIHHIPTISRLWEPLAYPLLFPHATLGWGIVGAVDEIFSMNLQAGPAPEFEQATTQIWHYRARLLREHRFHIFGRLTNEYIVDMWSRNLECWLKYIRDNQQAVHIADAELLGDDSPSADNIFLPSSFLGSNRWAAQSIADSLAIAAKYGPPTFFITMTCNPLWPKIQSRLNPGQTFADVPLAVCHCRPQRFRRAKERDNGSDTRVTHQISHVDNIWREEL